MVEAGIRPVGAVEVPNIQTPSPVRLKHPPRRFDVRNVERLGPLEDPEIVVPVKPDMEGTVDVPDDNGRRAADDHTVRRFCQSSNDQFVMFPKCVLPDEYL